MSAFGDHSAPPTVPDGALPPGESAWPGWIGGFAIGIGILVALSVCCGIAGTGMMSAFGKMGGIDVPSPPRPMVAFLLTDGVVGLGLATMLLMGGIGTLRRRQSGPRMLLRYAVVRLALAIPLLAAALWMLRPQAEWVASIARASNEWKERQNPPLPVTPAEREAEEPKDPGVLEVAPVVFGSAIGAIFPVVVLVVLRGARRRGEVTRWDA